MFILVIFMGRKSHGPGLSLLNTDYREVLLFGILHLYMVIPVWRGWGNTVIYYSSVPTLLLRWWPDTTGKNDSTSVILYHIKCENTRRVDGWLNNLSSVETLLFVGGWRSKIDGNVLICVYLAVYRNSYRCRW